MAPGPLGSTSKRTTDCSGLNALTEYAKEPPPLFSLPSVSRMLISSSAVGGGLTVWETARVTVPRSCREPAGRLRKKLTALMRICSGRERPSEPKLGALPIGPRPGSAGVVLDGQPPDGGPHAPGDIGPCPNGRLDGGVPAHVLPAFVAEAMLKLSKRC
jgi:hypothetical protein